MINQYNTKKGLQKFSDQGSATLEKEVRQLLTMDAIKPEKPTDITKEDQLISLGYLILLKEKHDVIIKFRVSWHGIKQRD